jgi:hypothetical protein
VKLQVVAPERALEKPRVVRRRQDRRRWCEWRQAYYPRRWPLLLLCLPPALAGRPGLALCVLLVDVVRIAKWRRRHPPLTPLELREVKRAWAPFN